MKLKLRITKDPNTYGPTICETKELQHKYYYDREASPS